MKLSLLPTSLFGLAALASANPVENRAFNVALTFHGVDGSTYGETFPADASQVQISQSPDTPLSLHCPLNKACLLIYDRQSDSSQEHLLDRRWVLHHYRC